MLDPNACHDKFIHSFLTCSVLLTEYGGALETVQVLGSQN